MPAPGTTGNGLANIDAFTEACFRKQEQPTLATVLAEVRDLRALVQALVDVQPPRSDVLCLPGNETIEQVVARYTRAAP